MLVQNISCEIDFTSYSKFLCFSDPRSFEKVQFGGRQIEDPSKINQQLSLGNKYAALQD